MLSIKDNSIEFSLFKRKETPYNLDDDDVRNYKFIYLIEIEFNDISIIIDKNMTDMNPLSIEYKKSLNKIFEGDFTYFREI